MNDTGSGDNQFPCEPLSAAFNSVKAPVLPEHKGRATFMEAVDEYGSFPINFDTGLPSASKA